MRNKNDLQTQLDTMMKYIYNYGDEHNIPIIFDTNEFLYKIEYTLLNKRVNSRDDNERTEIDNILALVHAANTTSSILRYIKTAIDINDNIIKTIIPQNKEEKKIQLSSFYGKFRGMNEEDFQNAITSANQRIADNTKAILDKHYKDVKNELVNDIIDIILFHIDDIYLDANLYKFNYSIKQFIVDNDKKLTGVLDVFDRIKNNYSIYESHVQYTINMPNEVKPKLFKKIITNKEELDDTEFTKIKITSIDDSIELYLRPTINSSTSILIYSLLYSSGLAIEFDLNKIDKLVANKLKFYTISKAKSSYLYSLTISETMSLEEIYDTIGGIYGYYRDNITNNIYYAVSIMRDIDNNKYMIILKDILNSDPYQFNAIYRDIFVERFVRDDNEDYEKGQRIKQVFDAVLYGQG